MANPMFDVIKGDLAQLEEHLLQAVTEPEPDITEIGSHLITSVVAVPLAALLKIEFDKYVAKKEAEKNGKQNPVPNIK